jgi:mono/diheme cytochrome c family protein
MFPGRNLARVFRMKTLVAALFLVALTGCRQKMADQPSYNPYEASQFFPDGMSARPRIEGTVARGELQDNPFLETGKINGQVGNGFPMAVNAELVDRGQSRFNIYCSQCHGRVGDGNGMIPARGYRHPPSFHTDKLRNAPTGHFFDVMTNGFGAMPPYRTMITVQDRWAIVSYIRALQLSQNATVADVPAGEVAKLDAPAGNGETHESTTAGGHH